MPKFKFANSPDAAMIWMPSVVAEIGPGKFTVSVVGPRGELARSAATIRMSLKGGGSAAMPKMKICACRTGSVNSKPSTRRIPQ